MEGKTLSDELEALRVYEKILSFSKKKDKKTFEQEEI
jgi:hypothetical protein